MAIYPCPLPDWFVPYGNKPSVYFDETHRAWYILQLGSREGIKDTFQQYLFAWEAPYTSVHEIALPIKLVHATLAPGGGMLWAAGLSERGFVFLDVPGVGGLRVLDADIELPGITPEDFGDLPVVWRGITKRR